VCQFTNLFTVYRCHVISFILVDCFIGEVLLNVIVIGFVSFVMILLLLFCVGVYVRSDFVLFFLSLESRLFSFARSVWYLYNQLCLLVYQATLLEVQ